MKRFCVVILVALCASYCTWDTAETSTVEQGIGSNQQGTQLQAIQLQGSVAGMTMQGFQLSGATLNGAPLTNVHLEKGELVADQNQVTLHGASLQNAHLIAQVKNLHVTPPTTSTVEYQITAVATETAGHDPTSTGGTFLYSLSQNVDGTGYQPACAVDAEGLSAAVPVGAIWNEHGDRVESSTLFTFSCTTGVIAKCYRWGYKPWLTGYGDVVNAHWACTRAARADYCGNGTPHTRDGTWINIWDNLPPPGPIQIQGSTPPLMVFEAGWNTGGAVCLSHARWLLLGPLIAANCPDRLVAPGLLVLGATVCDTVAQVLGASSSSVIFNESNLNLNLDLLGL